MCSPLLSIIIEATHQLTRKLVNGIKNVEPCNFQKHFTTIVQGGERVSKKVEVVMPSLLGTGPGIITKVYKNS